jgi:DNA-directed RNA polymerase subunit RPC12/RpoP
MTTFVKGKNLITTEDFITCPYCGPDSKRWRYLHWRHLKLSHNKKLDDVRTKFPDHPTMTKSFDDERLQGSQMSSRTHNQPKKIQCIHCETDMWVKKNEGNRQACPTCLSKGLENPDGRTKPEAQVNRVKTFQDKYGVDNPQQIEEAKTKASKTCDEKYGGRGFASKTLAKKTRAKIKDKYGAENIMQTEEGKFRLINSFKQKYGKEITNALHILEVKQKVSQTKQEYYKKHDHHLKGKSYIQLYGKEAAKKLVELRRKSGAKGHEMSPKISAPQLELFELVKEILPEARLEFGQNLEYNDERYYYFLDIAIYELMICIEYDGSYWHDEEHDKFRDEVLESFGWKVIRYVDRIPSKEELENDINKVL